MGLFDRVGRLMRFNLNSLVNKAEDPEKVLEQTVDDMQADLVQLRQALAQAIATQKRSQRQLVQSQTLAAEWQRRAQQGLQQGNEAAAREALLRRKSYIETGATIKAQLGQQSSIVTNLKQTMAGLECKVMEARTRQDLFIARARAAQVSQQLYQTYSRVNTHSALNVFDRMEERVRQLESQAEAMAELSGDELAALTVLERGDGLDNSDVGKEPLAGATPKLPQGSNSP